MHFLLLDKIIHDKITLVLFKRNEVSPMEHPYNEQSYQPVPPQEPIPPAPSLYQGNNNFATASLVMGILSLVFFCCAPPLLFIVAGLGILFSCLSKGQRARCGTAKAGLALSASTLAIMSAFLIFICTAFFLSPEGNSFFNDYLHILTDDNLTDEELYDFLNEYFNNSNNNGNMDNWDSLNSPDDYEEFDDFKLPPELFQKPQTEHNNNFI